MEGMMETTTAQLRCLGVAPYGSDKFEVQATENGHGFKFAVVDHLRYGEAIVRAVNSHDELVAALEGMLRCDVSKTLGGNVMAERARAALANATTQ